MKLVVVVVQAKDADGLVESVTGQGFRVTRIDSAGGFLRERNATLLIGVTEAQVAEVLRIVQGACRARSQFVNPLLPIVEPGETYVPSPVEVQIGGATIFVLAVERFERMS